MLEQRQQVVRSFRIRLSRKTDQQSFVTDTFNRLHTDATPILHKYNPKPMKKSKRRIDITEDDLLVKSFFVNEDEN